jgi:hypothetical protein
MHETSARGAATSEARREPESNPQDRAYAQGSEPQEKTSNDSQRQSQGKSPSEWVLEYEGAVSTTIRTLKMVSITTATLSLLGGPAYLSYTLDGSYTAAKVIAATGFMCFGVFTTGVASIDTIGHKK